MVDAGPVLTAVSLQPNPDGPEEQDQIELFDCTSAIEAEESKGKKPSETQKMQMRPHQKMMSQYSNIQLCSTLIFLESNAPQWLFLKVSNVFKMYFIKEPGRKGLLP